MKRTTALLALLILTVTSAVALAQPQHGEHPWREHRNPKEMTEAFRLYKLTEYLELSEEQTAKLFPRMAAINKSREADREAMQERMNQLRALVDEEEWSKAAKLADEIHALKAEHMASMQESHAAMARLLSEEQRAKLMLFEHRWGRHMRDMGEKIKRFKGPRAGRAGGDCDHEGPHGPHGDCDGEGPHGPRGKRDGEGPRGDR